MEERHCSKCSAPIEPAEKFCHNCGTEISPLQKKVPVAGKPVPAGALWLAAVLMLVGFVAVGTLAVYVAISSFDTQNRTAFFKAKPEPEMSEASALFIKERLDSLPPVASSNPYVILRKGFTVTFKKDTIIFRGSLQNISNEIIAGAGVNLEFFDVERNFVDSKGAWAHRDVLPDEIIELKIEIGNGQNIGMYRLSRIDGRPSDKGGSVTKDREATDDKIHLVSDKIATAMGDNPAGWVAQQVGKEFIITGPMTYLDSPNGSTKTVVRIGEGTSACYILVDHSGVSSVLNQIPMGTTIRMNGTSIQLPTLPHVFVLVDGMLEEEIK